MACGFWSETFFFFIYPNPVVDGGYTVSCYFGDLGDSVFSRQDIVNGEGSDVLTSFFHTDFLFV